MGNRFSSSSGNVLVEVIFFLILSLLLYQFGLLSIVVGYHKKMEAAQKNRIQYDGIPLWKD